MKQILLLLLLTFNTGLVLAHIKNVPTRADGLATGLFQGRERHPWPFPLLSIGHNMQSYQDYGGSPYWHDGLDIRSRKGESILASAGGKVVNVENYITGNPLYWEVAILDDEGLVWKYHHVQRESIPADIHAAFKSGKKIQSGTLLGTVVPWSQSSFGETYHHLHLLVVGKDGKYINPFLLLGPLADTRPPVIERIGLAQNHRPIEGNEVRGDHALYLQASDLVLHEKFILPPHRITYWLDGQEEKLLWEFVHLPSGTNDTDYITDFFMKGTCGNYSCRKFYFNLNFTPDRPRDTMKLSPGIHQVEVKVEDVAGNEGHATFSWKVL